MIGCVGVGVLHLSDANLLRRCSKKIGLGLKNRNNPVIWGEKDRFGLKNGTTIQNGATSTIG